MPSAARRVCPSFSSLLSRRCARVFKRGGRPRRVAACRAPRSSRSPSQQRASEARGAQAASGRRPGVCQRSPVRPSTAHARPHTDQGASCLIVDGKRSKHEATCNSPLISDSVSKTVYAIPRTAWRVISNLTRSRLYENLWYYNVLTFKRGKFEYHQAQPPRRAADGSDRTARRNPGAPRPQHAPRPLKLGPEPGQRW